VVTGAKNGAVYLWPTKAKPRSNEISGSWQPVAFSPDAKNLLALDHRGLLGFIDVATQEPKQLLELSDWRFPRPLSSVSATSDLKTVAEGLENGTVKLWNTRTRESTLLQVSERPVGIARISPNGRDLVAAGFGESLNWRDLVSGTNRKLPVDGHRALFSPDGSLLAVFSRNDSVSIWDIATHTLRTNLVLDPPPGFAAAFTPDSRGLAVSAGRGGTDDAIRLWDISRGRLVGTFTGHKQAVHALAFSPDGQTLVSASDDSTLKMWNVATRQELLTVRRLGAAINNLLFSPDCQVLAAGRGGFGQSAELRLYRAPYPLEEELLE
jgi:WD40 repeat protein